MIGRVGSIGRIPAELVVSPAQPVSSRRDSLGIAAGTRSQSNKGNACSLRRLAGCPTCFPWAPSRVLPRRESGPCSERESQPSQPSPAQPALWAPFKSADPVERVGSWRKEGKS